MYLIKVKVVLIAVIVTIIILLADISALVFKI